MKKVPKNQKPSPQASPLLFELTQNLLSIQNCAPFKTTMYRTIWVQFYNQKISRIPSMIKLFSSCISKPIVG
jgi:hypothetical protein